MIRHLIPFSLLLGLLLVSCTAIKSDLRPRLCEQARPGLADEAKDVCPLSMGDSIPDTTLSTVDGKPVKLRQAVGLKPTLLVFYRGGWCSYSLARLGEFRDRMEAFRQAGFQIIAISPDRPEKLKESIARKKIRFRLLSDTDSSTAKAFGLAFKSKKSANALMRFMGVDLAKTTGQAEPALPVPAIYLVSPDGVIQFSHADPVFTRMVDFDTFVNLAFLGLGNPGGPEFLKKVELPEEE